MNDTAISPPVLLILFNRPDITKMLISQLRLARPAKLYIAVDGPRVTKPNEEYLVAEVIKSLDEIDWPCKILTRISDANQGCKYGPYNAISWLFEHEEYGIILEDDCHPHPTFFPFCQELLNKYQTSPEVMMISGCDYSSGATPLKTSYYFHKYQLIWGWATWSRAWKLMDIEMTAWKSIDKNSFLRQHCASLDEKLHWKATFDKMEETINNSIWDYQWLFSMWNNNGKCISPVGNLISNVGYGDNATHTTQLGVNHSLAYHAISFPLIHPSQVSISIEHQEAIRKRAYMSRRTGIPYIAAHIWHAFKKTIKKHTLS